MRISNLIVDYDEENKTLFIRWGEDFCISEGYDNYILDFDTDHNVIGVELLHFDKLSGAGQKAENKEPGNGD